MPSNFLFRVTRGLAVVVAIVVTHFVIVWLFNTMKIPVPDMGPVFATISRTRASKQTALNRARARRQSKPGSASPAYRQRKRRTRHLEKHPRTRNATRHLAARFRFPPRHDKPRS